MMCTYVLASHSELSVAPDTALTFDIADSFKVCADMSELFQGSVLNRGTVL